MLFDVDNTLLDNDRIAVDLTQHLDEEIGTKGEQQYWVIFEELRAKLGYVDYPGRFNAIGRSIPAIPICLHCPGSC